MKIIYTFIGFISLGLGIAGIALPILPTTPFILLSAFMFANGSTRLKNWFEETRIYKKYCKGFAEKREMTLRTKLSILLPVTALLIVTMLLSKKPAVTYSILGALTIKYYYFVFRIKTVPANKEVKDVQ